ncbi:MAG: hypothetical protein LBK04_02075 [Clostridiales Family XIII bacterium]|nr:hypothetical protein [Clostridiales Family XIII bacterium]
MEFVDMNECPLSYYSQAYMGLYRYRSASEQKGTHVWTVTPAAGVFVRLLTTLA